MMKRFYSTIFVLLLAVPCFLCSCSGENDENTSAPYRENAQDILIKPSFLWTRAEGDLEPTVNTLRVIAFDEKGKCAANTLFERSNLTVAPKDGTNDYLVTSPEVRLTPSAAKEYEVYAILNEDGILSVVEGTTKTLSSFIGAITVGSTSRSTFVTYYNSRLTFNPAAAKVIPGSEPAFIISAMKNITIVTEGASLSENAVEVAFEGTETSERTLAMVTIEAINGDPGTGTDACADVSRIFILDAELENVPTACVWNKEDNSSSMGGGAVTEIKFSGKNDAGYFDRTWDGTITSKYALTKTETIPDTLWRDFMTDNNPWISNEGVGKGRKQTIVYTYDGKGDIKDVDKTNSTVSALAGYAAGYGSINDATKTDKFNYVMQQKQDYAVTQSPFVNLLDTRFNDNGVISEVIPQPSSNSVVSATPWSVTTVPSYYVPENISAEESGATRIHIRAAIGTPYLDVSSVTKQEWIDAVAAANNLEWEKAVYSTVGAEFPDIMDYLYKNKDGKYAWVKDDKAYKNAITNFFTYSLGVLEMENWLVWKDKQKKQNDIQLKSSYFYPYLTGFRRTQETSGDGLEVTTSTIPDAGITQKWSGMTSSAYIYDFYIPVNNQQIGGDYSVRRNTNYKVTLTMGPAAYVKMTTPSGDDTPSTASHLRGGSNQTAPIITATVQTESLEHYDEE